MTLSTALKQTDDVAQNAISNLLFQEGASSFALTPLYQNDGTDNDTYNGLQTIQALSIDGDDHDYVITYDASFALSYTISLGNLVRLYVVHLAINADNATLIAAQDETDYDHVGNNGTFVGGTGHSVSDVLTLNDGSTVTVDAVSGGVVTQFTVTTAGTGDDWVDWTARQQDSTTGSGVLFVLAPYIANTVDWANIKIITGLSTQAARVEGFTLTHDQDSQSSIWSTQVSLPVGAQYNFGTVVYKHRDDVADTLTGTVNAARSIQWVRYKR